MIFSAGSTAVRRDILDGKVFSAAPHRVLHDTGDELLLAHWPGIAALAPKHGPPGCAPATTPSASKD